MSDSDIRTDETSRQTALTVVPRLGGERRRTPRTASFALVRHDPSFVTHLIATAQQVPQTRTLRQASPEDVLTSYRSVASHNKPAPRSTSRVA